MKYLEILIIGILTCINAKKINDHIYEVILDVNEGYYQYKYLIDSKWYPEKNQILVVGENGNIFPKGQKGTGILSYKIDENINGSSDIRAIIHDMSKLIYFNKITDKEFEFSIRTQLSDVERVYICVCTNKSLHKIYELERYSNTTVSFDYFKRLITFDENFEKIDYHFILEDGGKKFYYGLNGLEEKLTKSFSFDNKKDTSFYVPY